MPGTSATAVCPFTTDELAGLFTLRVVESTPFFQVEEEIAIPKAKHLSNPLTRLILRPRIARSSSRVLPNGLTSVKHRLMFTITAWDIFSRAGYRSHSGTESLT